MASDNTSGDFDRKKEALIQLAQGKRHLLVKDYSEAVTSLALACEYLAQIFGETATEVGEAYFVYGKALLELARTENGVLGSAVEDKDGSPSEKEDEEEETPEAKPETEELEDVKELSEAEEESKAAENGDGDVGSSKVGVENATNGDGDAGSSKVGPENAINGNGAAESDAANGGGDAKEAENGDEAVNPEEDEEDVSNLHLAWEVLELAKLIYQREAATDESIELKLAEVNLKLGEVALESENYTEATQDMNSCLQLQLKHLKTDDRCVAETYYQIGVAYSLANQFDNAISAFASCGKLLELRISNLKEKIKEGAKPEVADPFYTYQGEIEELESLFPEIKEKIFDMQDFKKETMKAVMGHTASDGSDPGAGSSKDEPAAFPAASSSAAKPVSNIGHLVRKKRKSESEDSEDAAAKRACTEPDKAQ